MKIVKRENLFFVELSKNTVELVDVDKNVTQVIIPETIEIDGGTYVVTSIGYTAFENCCDLVDVEIPDTIVTIKKSFYSCEKITAKLLLYNHGKNCYGWIGDREKCPSKIVIPDGVEHIDTWAFKSCRNLKEIEIPNSVISMGDDVFLCCYPNPKLLLYNENKNCYGWIGDRRKCPSKIVLPNECSIINDEAFADCENLKDIEIPNTVTYIGRYAFRNCNSLRPKLLVFNGGTDCYGWIGNANLCPSKLTIPQGVVHICAGAFEDVNTLQHIIIPDSVVTIGRCAFYYCNNLESITIPDSVLDIGDWATFLGCEKLKKVVLSKSITYIGESVFGLCRNLQTLEIPNSVVRICSRAFKNCMSLKKIVIPKSVVNIGMLAFSGCEKLVELDIQNSSLIIEENAFGEIFSKSMFYYLKHKLETNF